MPGERPDAASQAELEELGRPAGILLAPCVRYGGMPQLPDGLMCVDLPSMEMPGAASRWEDWH